MTLRLMISAGESSGEMHGAAFIRRARMRGLDAEFFGLGGDRMAAAGARLIAHINDTAVMGLSFLGSLGRLWAILNLLKKALAREKPDLLILIDYPDFNFRLAKAAQAAGVPVLYYICPQVWAWRSGRLKFLARYTARRALLFKFEKDFYEARGLSADWVGHPVLDDLPEPKSREQALAELGFDPGRKLLALLPGSRRSVFSRLAPVMFQAAARLVRERPDLDLVLSRADSVAEDLALTHLAAAPAEVRDRLRMISGLSRRVLAAADVALLASGTSSLEALFLDTPMVVAYKMSSPAWFLARRLISVPFASVGNIVAGREVIPEFLQERVTSGNLARAVGSLLDPGPERRKALDGLAEVRAELGPPGASDRVLDIICQMTGLTA